MNTNPSRVDCPVDLLSWYVNGTLSPVERKSVETHLAHCPYCQTDVAQWRLTKDALHRAAVASPQPSIDVLANLKPLLTAPNNRRLADLKDGTAFIRSLLRAQIPLIRHDLWASSALVLIMGWLISFLLGTQQMIPSGAALAVVAPLITALGLSVVYGPENDAGLEWAMTSPTSPRLVLLCRFVLAFGYNLSLTLILFAVFKLILPNVNLMLMVDLWLGPMFFLSSISLFLSLVIGVNAAVAGSLTLWTLRVIALMPSSQRLDAFATMAAFWSSTPVLILLAAAFLVVGFTLVKREELFV